MPSEIFFLYTTYKPAFASLVYFWKINGNVLITAYFQIKWSEFLSHVSQCHNNLSIISINNYLFAIRPPMFHVKIESAVRPSWPNPKQAWSKALR